MSDSARESAWRGWHASVRSTVLSSKFQVLSSHFYLCHLCYNPGHGVFARGRDNAQENDGGRLVTDRLGGGVGRSRRFGRIEPPHRSGAAGRDGRAAAGGHGG